MHQAILAMALLSSCVLAGCQDKQASAANSWLDGDLQDPSCRSEVDQSDPNETPVQICPGAAGYSLVVRKVGSGRKSIDVVDPRQETSRLALQEVVTRHMFGLDRQLQWRLTSRQGQLIPVALVLRVHVHESEDRPEVVTQSYVAIAKITPEEVCITARYLASELDAAGLQKAADAAVNQDCAPAQPP